jgi:16S rRNA (cytidine1402-2'-O)-methyltransferase
MTKDPTQNEDDLPEAFAANGGNTRQNMPPGLYLVATPIGNLRDITLRALDLLRGADIIACEDTRVSGKLLQAYDIKKKLIPYHDHNADIQRPKIIEAIQAGQRVILISDAGMPLISDPGYKLVRDCAAAGLYVTSLPGANAPLTALQLSGLPSDRFAFLGFLPAKTSARKDILREWKSVPATLILFESAPRLEDCLTDILEVMGERDMAIARELTKMFEEVRRGTVSALLETVRRDGPPKGEIVLVVGRGEKQEMTEGDIDGLLLHEMKNVSLREAVDSVVAATGFPKKTVYARALALRDRDGDGGEEE